MWVARSLDYCNSLLAGSPQSIIDRLKHIQNQVIRVVKLLPYRAHVTPARIQLHWLPVRECIDFKLATFTYTRLSRREPEYLADLLFSYAPTRLLRSAVDSTHLVVPLAWTKFAERAFSFAAPSVWNSLPPALRELDSLPSFKNALKQFLFVRAP